jgi:hypothetical protein
MTSKNPDPNNITTVASIAGVRVSLLARRDMIGFVMIRRKAAKEYCAPVREPVWVSGFLQQRATTSKFYPIQPLTRLHAVLPFLLEAADEPWSATKAHGSA